MAGCMGEGTVTRLGSWLWRVAGCRGVGPDIGVSAVDCTGQASINLKASIELMVVVHFGPFCGYKDRVQKDHIAVGTQRSPLQYCPDDGVDRPALPVLPSHLDPSCAA